MPLKTKHDNEESVSNDIKLEKEIVKKIINLETR